MDPTNSSDKIPFSGGQGRTTPPLKGNPKMVPIQDPLEKYPEINTTSEYATCVLKAARELFTASKIDRETQVDTTPSVTFVLWAEGGYGDILFVYKAAAGLVNKGCRVDLAILPGRDKSAEQVAGILNQMPESGKMNIQIATTESKKTWETDCVFIGPTKATKEAINTYFPHLKKIPSQTIREYGTKKDNKATINDVLDFPVSAGIGPGQLGVFTGNGVRKKLTISEKEDSLHELFLSNQKKFSVLLKGAAPKDYLASNRLFFGYAHQSSCIERFVETVAFTEKDSLKNNLDIVIPWRKTNTGLPSEFKDKCRYNKRDLAQAGIGRIEIIDENGIQNDNISADGKGKVLRIINLFPMPGPDFLKILEISEDLCLITGDQSWNDAMLMAQKDLVYEKMPWKVDFYASTEQISMTEPAINSVMQLWQSRKPPQEVAQAVKNLNLAKISAVKEGEITPSEKYHRAIITEDNDLVESFHQEAIRLAACKKSPSLRRSFSSMEVKLKENFFVPALTEKIAQLLPVNIIRYVNDAGGKSALDEHDIPFLDHYKKLWDECDKKDLPPEVTLAIEKGFDLIEIAKKGGEISMSDGYSAARALFSVPSKVLPIAQQIFKKTQNNIL